MDRKEGIKMATDVLYEISQDEKARIQYENELIYELDVRSRISEGREEGREEGIAIGLNTALQIFDALKVQIPVEEIAVRHNLPIKEIERIKSTFSDK